MPITLIIFGASGDLAKRKLLPAIEALSAAGKLPANFDVVRVSRKVGAGYFQMDVEAAAEYARLAAHLAEIEKKSGQGQRLFYLAVPPAAVADIAEHLAAAGLLDARAELLLEKPFGTDLASAEAHLERIARCAREEQIYRVDHYLEKAIAARAASARADREPRAIESIEIVASETIGVEGRAAFYEQAGVLGDMLESHLLELLALVLMESPQSPDGLPAHRAAALTKLAPAKVAEATRGQYAGYREDVGNPKSIVATYTSVGLHSNDPTWAAVQLQLTAGKALAEKRTEIRINLKSGEQIVISAGPETFPSGYPAVLLDAIAGERARFVSADEVLAAWRVFDPLVRAWRASGDGLEIYPRGSRNVAF